MYEKDYISLPSWFFSGRQVLEESTHFINQRKILKEKKKHLEIILRDAENKFDNEYPLG